jgi:hypothetical protein
VSRRIPDGNVMHAENYAEREDCNSAKLYCVTNRCLVCAHCESSFDSISVNGATGTSLEAPAVPSAFVSANLDRP